ncbi:MAG: hypothetical protein MZV64_68505 [Ignavibacteriales bacterium]|nr:hypothetical protein [Ignavibacteriales bacterium]
MHKLQFMILKEKLMLPGFNDSHLHFTSGGSYLLGINLRPALSKEEFAEIIEISHFKKKPAGCSLDNRRSLGPRTLAG